MLFFLNTDGNLYKVEDTSQDEKLDEKTRNMLKEWRVILQKERMENEGTSLDEEDEEPPILEAFVRGFVQNVLLKDPEFLNQDKNNEKNVSLEGDKK